MNAKKTTALSRYAAIADGDGTELNLRFWRQPEVRYSHSRLHSGRCRLYRTQLSRLRRMQRRKRLYPTALALGAVLGGRAGDVAGHGFAGIWLPCGLVSPVACGWGWHLPGLVLENAGPPGAVRRYCPAVAGHRA